jgi:mannose-6-phosphate isomerase-like protein (cupin superfamily)
MSADPTREIIVRSSGSPEAVQRLGPYVLEALLQESEERSATAYRVMVLPNQRTNVSFHRVAEEFYYVIAGSGVAVLDGREFALKAGDFLRLPPGTTHGFITQSEALEMLDIHVPGCRPNRDVFFTDAVPSGFDTEVARLIR